MSLSAQQAIVELAASVKSHRFLKNILIYFCEVFVQAFRQFTLQSSYALTLRLKQQCHWLSS